MKLRRFSCLALVAMFLSAMAGCGGTAAESGSSTSPSPATAAESSRLLPPDQFERAIADPARFTINVHVPFEGALPDTDLMIAFDRIEQEKVQLPADRGTPIAVYCKTGRMSAIASETLTSLGYLDVIDLQGGMNAWQAAGRPLLPSWSTGADS